MAQTSEKTTLVLGASPNPARYSYLAVQRLRMHGHPVIAIGKRPGNIGDIDIQTTPPPPETAIDTVTLYLNPTNQKEYYDYLLELQPQRIIFNPGTENPELMQKAQAAGIHIQQACTLVLLSTHQY